MDSHIDFFSHRPKRIFISHRMYRIHSKFSRQMKAYTLQIRNPQNSAPTRRSYDYSVDSICRPTRGSYDYSVNSVDSV